MHGQDCSIVPWDLPAIRAKHPCNEALLFPSICGAHETQGTEEALANAKDTLEVLVEKKPLEECDTSQWLFPSALPSARTSTISGIGS